MKKIIKITLSLLFIAASFTSCIDDKDFDTPQVACNDSFIDDIKEEQITTFQNVYDQWFAENTTSDNDQNIVSFIGVDADPVYLIGYVTSNDLKGNFYKELYIQDNFENPTMGLKLTIDERGLYTKYPKGSKIYIKLNGLAIEKSHGELSIGEFLEGDVARIRSAVVKSNIKRSCSIETIIPKQITPITEINNTLVGQYVQFTNAQFSLSLINKPFKDPNESYSTLREIVFCESDFAVRLETSSYAQYAEETLPKVKFNISGILSRDYGDDNYVLIISSTDDIELLDTGRCDPIYEEDFESYTDYSTSFGPWININANGGNELFQTRSYSGNRYVEGSAYNSGENPLEMWLISEGIDLDGSTNEVLTFKTQAHHANGVSLSVFVSTDYSDDINSATWIPVDAIIGTATSTYGPWTNSGPIDISSLEGTVHIAFKYTGGDGGVTTGMNIDDIKITGND